MKKLLTILCVLIATRTYAIGPHFNYYISASGDNTTGRSPSTAWRTIDKITANMSLFVPGDSILFNCGETFTGRLNFSRAGSIADRIVLGSYGTGAKPIISGLATVTSWANLGGNIWEATVAAPPHLNLVLRNGAAQQVGRFPNANAANGGYLTYDTSGTTWITGSALSTTTNWTGAEVAIRVARWDIRKRKVTSHSAGTVNWATSISPRPKNDYGYFFQRDRRTLDQDGEWYFNDTTKLRMYFANNNPSAYTIQYGLADTVLNITKGYVTVLNLAITGGNQAGIMTTGGSGYNIFNCRVYNNGGDGIAIWFFTSDVFVTGCMVYNNLASGIRAFGATTSSNLNIQNDTVLNTSLTAGMEQYPELGSAGSGIYAKVQSGLNVSGNIIRNSAYNGIYWKGENVLITHNLVDTFCSVRDDGGGIYTFEAAGGPVVHYTNRVVSYNIVLHGIGAMYGAPLGTTFTEIQARRSANGIYCDEATRDVQVFGNTVGYMPYHGLTGNGNGQLSFRDNTIFQALISHSFQRLQDEPPIQEMVLKNNIFYPLRFRFRDQKINLPAPKLTQVQDIARFGIIDSNWYSLRAGTDTSINVQTADSVPKGQSANFSEIYQTVTYLKGTVLQDVHSISAANTGTLYYNDSYTLKLVKFPGLRKKDPKGVNYDNQVSIAAYASLILIDNGTVPVPNQPPVADAGADITVTLPTNGTTLTGTASDDVAVSSVHWDYISGPATYTIGNASAASTSLTNLVQGTYQFRFTATDGQGLSTSDALIVTVNPAVVVPNVNPTVNPGPAQTLTLPANSLTMNALGADSDGSIASYFWDMTSGPATFNIVTPSAANTVINGLVAGVYNFRVTVTDNRGGTAFGNVKVTVLAPPNQQPVANAGAGQTITLPVSSVTLNGTATDDGTITAYHWQYFSGPATFTIVSPNSASTVVNNLVAGDYEFQLIVTDNGSPALKDSSIVIIHVNAAVPPPNRLPLVDPGPDQSIVLPANSVTMNAQGTDFGGFIASYFWDKTSGPTAFNIVSPSAANTVINGLVAGVYTFRVTVTDNEGGQVIGSVRVTVTAPPNQAPSANAGSGVTLTLPTNSTTLTGSGTDDGTIIAYHWQYFSGPATYTIASPNSATTNITGLVQGTYEFELVVTDNGSPALKDSSRVIIVVNPAVVVANILPTIVPGPGQTLTLPANSVTMNALASDADGSITGYFWSKISGPASYNIVTPSARNTVINGLVEGTYVFKVTATDNRGGTVFGNVTIVVNAAINLAPQAYAGQDIIMQLPQASTVLTGSGDDADGTITNYSWTIASGPSGSVFSNASAASTTLSNLVAGIYQVDLTVTDNGGKTSIDRVQLTVLPQPTPPAEVPSSTYIIFYDTIIRN